ncbi:hypothetical protein GCM10010970_30870 [Silvimonas iriomotensis]|uniref:Uncharacterized protein n=1 Tax=Silvimonas iriomotensis TaxID=449662 RepID=A0ABQ2PCA2_9NEIS|nr:hypothetical protein GCM10010970_30870 [Silvimonas iriomotensis]
MTGSAARAGDVIKVASARTPALNPRVKRFMVQLLLIAGARMRLVVLHRVAIAAGLRALAR